MTTLITGDLHLNDGERDAYRFKFFEALPELCARHKADELIINGDLTDAKDRHTAGLVNRILDGIEAAASVVDAVIVNRGNHDYTNPQNPFFKFLNKLPGVTYVNEPSVLSLSGGTALFLPHTYDYKRDWAPIDVPSYMRVFAHNTFEGTIGDNGHRMSGIPLTEFGRAVVYAGDVHTPQSVRQHDATVLYVGAPYLVDFGDVYQPRVMLLADKARSIPIFGPQKRLVESPADTEQEKAKGKGASVGEHDGMSWGTWGPMPLEAGDLIKMRVYLTEREEPHWPEIRARWKAWAVEHKFILWQISPVIERRSAGSAQRPEVMRQDDDATMLAYGKARSVGGRTLEIGRKLSGRV